MSWFHLGKKKEILSLRMEAERVAQVIEDTDEALSPLLNFQMDAKYQETFKFLWYGFWDSHIPASGQSKVLQAEFLRRIEKLQHEATANGNVNWDENFTYFCEWLLTEFAKFDEVMAYMNNAQLILIKLKNHGAYAQLTWTDDFPEAFFEPKYIAYCGNSLYDYLYEMVCVIYESHPEVIDFVEEQDVYR